MPHIIIEYAEQLLSDEKVSGLLETIHGAIAKSGLFDASHIKTRAYPFRLFSNAGSDTPYIHIQARIKSGRDAGNKKRLADTILADIKKLTIPASVITVEVIDMDRDSYGKYVSE